MATDEKFVKRHKILDDIQTQLAGNEVSDTFKVAGHEFFMTTLTTDEDTWCAKFATDDIVSSSISLRPVRVAASIKKIDGVPVSELFEPTAEQRDALTSKPLERYFQMRAALAWLSEMQSSIVDELFMKYQVLVRRRDESWGKIKN